MNKNEINTLKFEKIDITNSIDDIEDNIKIDKKIYEDIINYFNQEYEMNFDIIKKDEIKINTLLNLKKYLKTLINNIIIKRIEKENRQLTQNILNLEKGIKYYIQQNFLKKTKIDMLENEISVYMEMEEEYEEMKIKFKYDNGEFLKNEKKENEILILRAENSNLKKYIENYEIKLEEYEKEINKLKNQIKKLEETKDIIFTSEKQSSNNSKSKDYYIVKPLTSITRRTNYFSQRNFNETNTKDTNNKNTSHQNNKSASISINENYNNNKVKRKIKSQKKKKKCNIVLNMKQVRKLQKSNFNLIGSPFNKSFNTLIKSPLSSTVTKHSSNKSNIINMNINFIDNNNLNYNLKSNKKKNITNPNNSKNHIPFNREDLILLRYKNKVKSPSNNSKSQNNSNILCNIINNNFSSNRRTKYKKHIMDAYIHHNKSLSKRDSNISFSSFNYLFKKK